MNSIKPARILFVSHSSGMYGAERSLLTLVEGLKAAGGHDMAVLLPKRGPLHDELQSCGIETRIVRSFGWISSVRGLAAVPLGLARTSINLIAVARAWRWVRRWNPDVIYSNSVASPLGLLLAASLGKPHIWHVRELVIEQMAARYDLGERLAMALADRWTQRLICNSRVVADKLSNFFSKSKLAVVYNGFDFRASTLPDASAKYDRTVANAAVIPLAIIGSVQPSKGQEDGIRALAKLVSEGVPVCLEIIGSGPKYYEDYLKSLAGELSVQDRVRFSGYSQDVAGAFPGIALMLLTSRFEVFGRVVVESLAHGTPVIASRAGGIPEVLTEDVTGLCYRPGDHDELAVKIAAVLKDRGLYEKLVVNGWRDVKRRFSKDNYVNSIRQEIFEVMERKVRPDDSLGVGPESEFPEVPAASGADPASENR